jgi:hypothetical protein
VPGIEDRLSRFRTANTQVLGVSVDSVYCHANWGRDLGGISFPLLADFHPKGQVAKSYGLYLEEKGITDRATVIVDAAGTVRYANSVTPAGERDLDELVRLCADNNAKHGKGVGSPQPQRDQLRGSVLYVKSRCGFSRAALLALENLHLGDIVAVKNVSEEPAYLQDLKKAAATEQAPCLVIGEKAMLESADIVQCLAKAAAPLA